MSQSLSMAMLADRNITIYSGLPENPHIRQFIRQNKPRVSIISKVEVLGYRKITASVKQDFEEFFASATVLDITEAVIDEAVRLRQKRKMSLGDAIIAATALVHGLTLHQPANR